MGTPVKGGLSRWYESTLKAANLSEGALPFKPAAASVILMAG